MASVLLLTGGLDFLGGHALASTPLPYPKKLTSQQPDVVITSGMQAWFAICLGDRAPAFDRQAAEWLILILLGSPESNARVREFSKRRTLGRMPAGAYAIRVLDTPHGQMVFVAGKDREGT